MRDNVSILLAGIEEGGERIKKIVSDMKDFARPNSSALRDEVDINSVIKAALTLLSNKIKKTTENFVVNLEGVPLVRGNYQRLEQVLVNLVMNALEAVDSKEKSIEVRTIHDSGDNLVRVEISDQGIGITSEDLKRIFDPFFTTKREQGGIGLGLCITMSIVKAHGGDLKFESKSGVGTTASLSLPAIEKRGGHD